MDAWRVLVSNIPDDGVYLGNLEIGVEGQVQACKVCLGGSADKVLGSCVPALCLQMPDTLVLNPTTGGQPRRSVQRALILVGVYARVKPVVQY